MYKLNCNAYYLNNKIVEIITTTGEGSEKDKELESHEKTISELLAQIVKAKKPEKKAVYFIEWSGSFFEGKGGKLDRQTEFTMKKTDFTPASFKKIGKQLEAADLRELNRPDKDEKDV
jgi:hypothetical protein